MLIGKMAKNFMMFSTVSAHSDGASSLEATAKNSIHQKTSYSSTEMLCLLGGCATFNVGYMMSSIGYHADNKKLQIGGAVLMLSMLYSATLADDYQDKPFHTSKP